MVKEAFYPAKKFMNELSKKWAEAAKILAKDTSAMVKCPECGIGNLKVKDELIEKWNKLDRYLTCDNCGKWNVLTMEIPENYPRPNPGNLS